jgi:hypothetical protein
MLPGDGEDRAGQLDWRRGSRLSGGNMVDDPRIQPMELAQPAIYALERANSEYSAGRMTIEVTLPDGRHSSETSSFGFADPRVQEEP